MMVLWKFQNMPLSQKIAILITLSIGPGAVQRLRCPCLPKNYKQMWQKLRQIFSNNAKTIFNKYYIIM